MESPHGTPIAIPGSASALGYTGSPRLTFREIDGLSKPQHGRELLTGRTVSVKCCMVDCMHCLTAHAECACHSCHVSTLSLCHIHSFPRFTLSLFHFYYTTTTPETGRADGSLDR